MDPSAGLEGLDEDNRLWWDRYERACDTAARGAEFVRDDIGICGAMKPTLRTEEENMPRRCWGSRNLGNR